VTTENNFLTAEDIFNSDDIDYIKIEVPEWKKNGVPGKICFRAMTAAEAIKFIKEGKNAADSADNYVRVVAETAVVMDADGNPTNERLFKGDVAIHKLKEKKSGIFIRLQKAIMKLNNLDGGDEVKEAKNG
jgi:hypothetical protein